MLEFIFNYFLLQTEKKRKENRMAQMSAHRRVWKRLSDGVMLHLYAYKCTKISGRVHNNKAEAQNTSKKNTRV